MATNSNNNALKKNKKLYVLDTNVVIHDPLAMLSFKGAHVGFPITVIEELDNFKGENSQRGRNAREIIRVLDKIRQKGSLAHGVTLDDGTFVQILLLPPREKIVSELPFEEPDNKIVLTALWEKQRGFDVYFISKDLNTRIKADALGLHARDYEKETIAEDNFYKGWIEIDVPAVELNRDQPTILQDTILDFELLQNQFVLLRGKRHENHYRIFRYLGDKKFKEVHDPKFPWPIRPRNPQQKMAFDLLLDDSIQLVSLFGPAGTGKTFLTLVAALQKLLIEHTYQKLLVARPVVPLGRDIGYLPGDMQEKLYSWMQPVRDNMEFIIHKARASYRGEGEDIIERKKSGKEKRRTKRHTHSSMPTLDELVRADKISLEAITYMRGRSIPYQFILIDEVQNLTPHEVKTLVTRVGEGSKIVLCGDPYQIDSPYLDFSSNGLVVASERFKGQPIFGTIFLETSERSELSQLAAELL